LHEVLPDGPTRRDLFRAAGAGAVLPALCSFFPRAGIAEVVENVLPRGRTRQTIHRDPRYYPLRNHLLDFLVTRSKRYRNGAANGAARTAPYELPREESAS
jgi:hypothetical protein